MLWIGFEVAWLRLGSCTDHVMNAAAAALASAISASPASSRTRRVSISRIESGSRSAKGITRSIILMHGSAIVRGRSSTQHLNDAMQGFCGGLAVLHQRKTDVTLAGIRAVGLLARQVGAGDHAHAGLLVETQRHLFAAA